MKLAQLKKLAILTSLTGGLLIAFQNCAPQAHFTDANPLASLAKGNALPVIADHDPLVVDDNSSVADGNSTNSPGTSDDNHPIQINDIKHEDDHHGSAEHHDSAAQNESAEHHDSDAAEQVKGDKEDKDEHHDGSCQLDQEDACKNYGLCRSAQVRLGKSYSLEKVVSGVKEAKYSAGSFLLSFAIEVEKDSDSSASGLQPKIKSVGFSAKQACEDASSGEGELPRLGEKALAEGQIKLKVLHEARAVAECSKNLSAADKALRSSGKYIDMLESARTYKISGDRLILMTDKEGEQIVFRAFQKK